MKHFLVTLDIGEQAAIEAASSLYNSVTEVVYTATNMAAHVNKVMNDLFKVYSEIEEETPVSYTHLDVYKRQAQTQVKKSWLGGR